MPGTSSTDSVPAPDRPPGAASTAAGSASRSSSRRQPATAGARSRRSVSGSVAPTCRARRQRAPSPVPCGSRSAGVYGAPCHSSTPVDRAGAEEVEAAPRRVERRPVRQPQRERARACRRRRTPRRRAARDGVVAKTSRIVSLNCRTLANPAANAIVRQRRVGRLDQQARGLRALRAGQRERAGAELGGEHPVQVPLGVAEPVGQPRHARRARRRRRRSAASPARRGRRARSSPASPARRRAGSAGRPGSRWRCAAAAVG